MSDIYKPNIQKVAIEAVIPELILAEPITVDGEVSIDGTVAVTGTVAVSNFPATQPVSGTVTIQDGGNIITVDGTVAINNFPSDLATASNQVIGNANLAQIDTNTDALVGVDNTLDNNPANDNASLVTQAVIMGKNPNGDFINARTNAAGALSASDFLLGVAGGDFPGYSIVNIYGANEDIDTGSGEDVWDAGGFYTGQPTHSAGAEAIEVLSSSANDTSAGTGARTVRVYGLDANFDIQTQDVTLNGVTPVDTAGTFKRCFRIEVLTAGALGANAGTITARHTTTVANVFATIPIGDNISHVGAYTVPNNTTLYLFDYDLTLVRVGSQAVYGSSSLRLREEGSVYKNVTKDQMTGETQLEYSFRGGLQLLEKTDLIIRINTVGGNDSKASTNLIGLLVEDT